MKDPKAAEEQAAARTWYKQELDVMVKEMLKAEAVSGAAIEASPVWMAPHHTLIAKIWDASQKSRFIWAISSKHVGIDHIAGSVANNPREVARHFSLKWQMDANQLLALAQEKTQVENSESRMKEYTDKLIAQAEALYDLTLQDEAWK